MAMFKKRQYILFAVAALAVLFLAAGIFIMKQSDKVVHIDFTPIEYQVITSYTDQTDFQDGVNILDENMLHNIISVNSKKNEMDVSKRASGYFVKNQKYVLPPNASYPFGVGFIVDTVLETNDRIVIHYREADRNEIIQNKEFYGTMAVDMNTFIPAYAMTQKSTDGVSNVQKMMITYGGSSPAEMDLEGYITVDLGKVIDSNIDGEVKIRMSSVDVECNLANSTCVVKSDYDFIISLSLQKKITKDICLGSIPIGFGVDGLAGAFIRLYLRPSISGEVTVYAESVIRTQYGVREGKWANLFDTEVNNAEPKIKASTSVCLGISPEISVLSEKLMYGTIYGGMGFDAVSKNQMKCYDISGYYLLYGEFGLGNWATFIDTKKYKADILNKSNAMKEELSFHYEIANGLVEQCSYMSISEQEYFNKDQDGQIKSQDKNVNATAINWKDAYVQFLEKIIPERLNDREGYFGVHFSFVDINNDKVPELVDLVAKRGTESWELDVYCYEDGIVKQLGDSAPQYKDPVSPFQKCKIKSTGEDVLLTWGSSSSDIYYSSADYHGLMWRIEILRGEDATGKLYSKTIWREYISDNPVDITSELGEEVKAYIYSEEYSDVTLYFLHIFDGKAVDKNTYERKYAEYTNDLERGEYLTTTYYQDVYELGDIYYESKERGLSDVQAADIMIEELFARYLGDYELLGSNNQANMDAYKAYLEVLRENQEYINGYSWKSGYDEENQDPPKAIAFTDIYGDSIPEMIVVQTKDPNDRYSLADLHIYSYYSGKMQQLYSDTWDENVEDRYYFYQVGSDKALRAYYTIGDEWSDEIYYVFAENDEGKLFPKLEYLKHCDDYTVGLPYEYFADKKDNRIDEDTFNKGVSELENNTCQVVMCHLFGLESRYKHLSPKIEANGILEMDYEEAVLYLKNIING